MPVLEIGNSRLVWNQRPTPAHQLDLEQVAGAMVFDPGDGADRVPFVIEGRETDEVGVIIFPLFEGRQRGSIDFNQGAAQRFRSRSIGNVFETGHRRLAAVPNRKETPFGAPHVQLLVARQALAALAEQLQAKVALDAVRARDCGERNSTLAAFAHLQP